MVRLGTTSLHGEASGRLCLAKEPLAHGLIQAHLWATMEDIGDPTPSLAFTGQGRSRVPAPCPRS